MNRTKRKKVDPRTKLGLHLRLLREQADLNQAEVAARAGLSQTDLSKIERGHRWPSLPQFFAICDALGVTVEKVRDEAGLPPGAGGAL